MTESYPDDIDCVWLASDRAGHIAAFTTGGSGPIPASLLGATDETEAALQDLPKISAARLLAEVHRPDSFVELAQCGLFVYDWTDVHRTAQTHLNAYELVAVPVTPIAADLLRKIGGNVICINLPDVVFGDGGSLDIRAHTECEGGTRCGAGDKS